MDYLIRRKATGLDSTAYMEIGPGRYSGKHWQEGFLFVGEDAFKMAEGILARHFPDYDHFAMNQIPMEVGMKIIDEWQQAADALHHAIPSEAARLLRLDASRHAGLENEITRHADAIAAMLKELSSECRAFYERDGWICVLGM
jgi:hypothetical protein